MTEKKAPLKNYSPLKWPGGKRWLAPTLKRIYAPHRERRLVELFCGACNISLCVRPDRALLNDLNMPLTHFLKLWSFGDFDPAHPIFVNESKAYYAARERFNWLATHPFLRYEPETAYLFYYLNRTCFNGLMRFSQKGIFNAPYGKYENLDYAKPLEKSALDQRWQVSNKNFRQLDLDPTDFVYADPPYDDGFVAYTAAGFSWDNQVQLVEFLDSHPGPVLISNAATPRIVALYKEAGYTIYRMPAPRYIAANGNRTPVLEVLAAKNVEVQSVNH